MNTDHHLTDRVDEDAASVAVRMNDGHTDSDRVGVGNLPVAGNEGAADAVVDVAEVGVFAVVVEIARMRGPFRARIQCRRLDFPVDRCRRVLCRGKPAPRSRRPSAHRRDRDP